MKRTVAMLIAVLLAVAVALPVMASPYTDLPDVHWALSAVYELSALGIFEGYPDGTFKGPQPATRYEVAIVISRLLKYLDQEISARMAALEAKIPAATATAVVPTPVPTPAPVTTVVQVEPDQTILETIIKEKIEALVGPKFEDIDERIAELYAMIQDLKTEFARELSVLGVRLTALENDLATIKERLAKAEANIGALQLQLDPALVRITILESRANAVDRQLEELNLALSQKAKTAEADALAAQIYGLQKDNAALAARLAALEGKPNVVIPAMPIIPASAKPEDVEALKALILSMERDKADMAARLAALEGKPGIVIPAAAKPEEVDALKALMLGLQRDNAALAARLATLEGKPDVVIPAMPIIPASAKPEEVEALKALMLSMERDKAALAARVSALEAGQLVVAAPVVSSVVSSGVSAAELAQVRALVLNLEVNKVDVLMSKLGALESKVLALESKLNTVDTRVGNLELKSNELEAKVDMLAKQSGQNATDIIDVYSLSYKNTDDLNFLKADLAAKFADLEARLAAKPDVVASVPSASPESVALLKLDILEAQDDIEKLKALYAQVGDLTARLDATESKLMLLDEKVAMLNMDLAALESEKVDSALVRIGLLELQTADLYSKYGMLAEGVNSLGLDVSRNSDDINDLYIQTNKTNNLLKYLDAADLALNERVTAIEVANKISADALAARVTFLEGASAENAAAALSLRNGLMGLVDRVSNLWINKFLLSGSFEVKFTDVAVVMGPAYKDPFDNTSTQILPSNSYYGQLKLTATIKPEPGVEINVGLNAAIDTYGISDASATIFNGDLDIKITSPNGYGQLIGGEQTRPKYLSKYVFSSILFAAEKFEGLGGWAKYASDMEGLTLGASAIVAKKGSTTDFRYVWGMAGNVNYANVADLTLYYFAIDDAPNSGDIPGVYDGTEDHIGLSANFKMGDNWSTGAFANLFFNDVNPDPESALTAYIKGKVGPWNMSIGFERVSDAYTPMYGEFSNTDDPDIIENDIMNLTMSNSFDVLPNLVFGLDTELNGDDDWANLTHINEVYAKYSFGNAYGLFNGSLKLYGGRESDIVVGGVWNVPVPDADGLCYAGADLKLKLYIFNAGFSYYTETYDVLGVYAGIINKYTAYLNTELTLIPDILKAKAGWKGVFGDFAGNYQEFYGELNLTTGFAVKWNLAANLGVYFKTTTMFKAYADAKLTYNLSNTASLYGMVAGEYRDYVSGAKPDGLVVSAGVGYNQKIFSATSLVADFTTKYVKYTFNPGGYSDNLVNTLGIRLSTTF